MKIVILLGGPGSGKGTLAARLVAADGAMRHVSSGDLLRGAVKDKTAAGLEAEGYMKSGALVPDRIIATMIADYITANQGDFTMLLDGFPRTVVQAELLNVTIAQCGATLQSVVLLNVADDVLVERIAGRRTCPACGAGYHVPNLPPKVAGVCDQCGTALIVRKDDNPETVKNRLAVYKQQTLPLIDFYTAAGVLQTVVGGADIPLDSVVQQAQAILAK